MNEITTTDLAKFGWREKRMAAELLNAMIEQGLPEDFEDDEITIMFNTHSGNVFLTNSEYQVAMMNGEKLESFYITPYHGYEGFAEDLKEMFEQDGENWDQEDIDYLIELGIIEVKVLKLVLLRNTKK